MSSTRATAFTRTTSAIRASLAVATEPALLGSTTEQQRQQLTILLRNALEKLEPAPDPTTSALAAWEVETFGAPVTGTEQETPLEEWERALLSGPAAEPAPRYAVRELACGGFSVTRDGTEECVLHDRTAEAGESHRAFAVEEDGKFCTWRPLIPGKVEPEPEPESPPRYVVIEHPEQSERWAVKDTVEREYETYAYRTRGMAEDWAQNFNGAPTRGGFFDYGWAALPGEEPTPEPEDLTARFVFLLRRDGVPGIVDTKEERFAAYDLEGHTAALARRGLEAIRNGRNPADWTWTPGIPEARFEAVVLPDGKSTILDHVEKRTRALSVSLTTNRDRATTLNDGSIGPDRLVWARTSAAYDRATRPRFEVVTLEGDHVAIADHEKRRTAGFYGANPEARLPRGESVRELTARLNDGEAPRLFWDEDNYRDDLTVIPAP